MDRPEDLLKMMETIIKEVMWNDNALLYGFRWRDFSLCITDMHKLEITIHDDK